MHVCCATLLNCGLHHSYNYKFDLDLLRILHIDKRYELVTAQMLFKMVC